MTDSNNKPRRKVILICFISTYYTLAPHHISILSVGTLIYNIMDLEPQHNKQQQAQSQPYTLEPISISLSTQLSPEVSLQECTLQVTDQHIAVYHSVQEEWLVLTAVFAKTNSVGVSGTSLMVFIGDQEDEAQEDEQHPIVAAVGKKQPGNYFLNSGAFTLTLNLATFGTNVVKQLNDLLVGYLGSGDDNRYEDDQQMGQMISAEHINNDGTLLHPPNHIQPEQAPEEQQQGSSDDE